LIVVKRINSNFGKKDFIVEAVVYDSEESKKSIEVIPKKIKKKLAEEEKKKLEEEKKAKAEAKKAFEEAKKDSEEKKVEESKEETKSEEK